MLTTPGNLIVSLGAIFGALAVLAYTVHRSVGYGPEIGLRRPNVIGVLYAPPQITRQGKVDWRTMWSIYLACAAVAPWVLFAADAASNVPWSWGSAWPWLAILWSAVLMAASWVLGTSSKSIGP